MPPEAFTVTVMFSAGTLDGSAYIATLSGLARRTLGARKPASLEICALLTKPERREVEVPVRYVGFEIPNRFVIGYGLDFAERYRNLPYIGVLHPDLVPNGL